VAGFARWCFCHRKTVLAVWLIALVACLAIGRSAGSTYAKSLSLPGTGSNRAQAVLEADFPVQAGESDQIVVRAKRGTLRTPAVEATVRAMFAKVSRFAVRQTGIASRPSFALSKVRQESPEPAPPA
jgi:RND superfamily putative drug exporter